MTSELTPQPRPEPTREQLEMAYRHLANPHWPPPLDLSLERWSYKKVLYSQARILSRPEFSGGNHTGHSLPRGPVPRTPEQHELYTGNGRPTGSIARGTVALGQWPTLGQRSVYDVKRAAANDLDKDTA